MSFYILCNFTHMPWVILLTVCNFAQSVWFNTKHVILITVCNFTHCVIPYTVWFYTQCVILHAVCDFTHSVCTVWNIFEILLCCGDLRCFVVRQFLSQIYALLIGKLSGLKICWCKKRTNIRYAYWPHFDPLLSWRHLVHEIFSWLWNTPQTFYLSR